MPSASAATLLQPCKGSEAYSVSTCARTEKPAAPRLAHERWRTCKRCECRAVRVPTVSVSSVAWSVARLCLVHRMPHHLLCMTAQVCHSPDVALARRAMSGGLLILSMPNVASAKYSRPLSIQSLQLRAPIPLPIPVQHNNLGPSYNFQRKLNRAAGTASHLSLKLVETPRRCAEVGDDAASDAPSAPSGYNRRPTASDPPSDADADPCAAPALCA